MYFIDSETTSLTGYLVEIAILDPAGHILVNRVINLQAPVDPDARAIHQIEVEELTAAPTLLEIWPKIVQALADRTLIITYNTAFDQSIIEGDAARYHLALPPIEWDCLMLWYAQYVGEWSHSRHGYRWQRLPGGSHRALGDAQAALALLKAMAKTPERSAQ